MSETYAARMAERIESLLTGGHPFRVVADPPNWKGQVMVEHPNGLRHFFDPLAFDKRTGPTEEEVGWALDRIRGAFTPSSVFTDEWQAKQREAGADWAAALNGRDD